MMVSNLTLLFSDAGSPLGSPPKLGREAPLALLGFSPYSTDHGRIPGHQLPHGGHRPLSAALAELRPCNLLSFRQEA